MRVLSYGDLKTKGVPYSECQIWRLVKQGKFPAPIRWSSQRKGWIEAEIDQHIESKIAERDSDAA